MRRDRDFPKVDKAGIRIDVHGGVHDDASSTVCGQQITIVGSAIDSDLRLTDTGIAAHHLAISTSGEQFVVRAMEGGCKVNGKNIHPGHSTTITCGDRIALNDTDVSLTTATSSAARDGLVRSDAEKVASAELRRPGIKLYALITLLVIGSSVGGQQLLSKEIPQPDAATGIANVLASLDLEGEVAVSVAAEGVTLTGVLPDRKSAALELALQSQPRNIVNRTQSVGRLLEQVRSVFRTNGYHAELRYVGDGAVQITNLDGENQKIQRVAVRARDDVSILTALNFAPIADADRSGKRLSVYTNDPGKRLTTIVDGDTAYVATTDGGRYFVGSVLPGGLVLRDISADGIQVDDNGEIHWLAL